jgi:hypothetical protein
MAKISDDPKKWLAYFWSIVSAIILIYIVYKFGEQKEILTLIIGLVGGTIIGGILGFYYAGDSTHKPAGNNNASAEISATITTKPDELT